LIGGRIKLKAEHRKKSEAFLKEYEEVCRELNIDAMIHSGKLILVMLAEMVSCTDKVYDAEYVRLAIGKWFAHVQKINKPEYSFWLNATVLQSSRANL
jgi:hypothetical protein